MTQETFLRAWNKRESFKGDAALRTWLYRIAHRRDGSSVSHKLLAMEVKKVGARDYERDTAN